MADVFAAAVVDYEREARKYRDFFDPEAMDEFRDDPNAFKQMLARDVPVIAGTLMQRRSELKEWQRHFRAAKPKDLLEVFSNLMEFAAAWSAAHPEAVYAAYDDPNVFELNPLDDDETMYITNVIGMGIKSFVLYHMDASRFPARGRDGLYGLYFLSECDHFGLPSKSSEFLMINDRSTASNGSFVMDQNYWYPYGVFSVYALRIFRWMSKRLAASGQALDTKVRHVFVQRFLHEVCAQHTEDLKTMRAYDRFEVPA